MRLLEVRTSKVVSRLSSLQIDWRGARLIAHMVESFCDVVHSVAGEARKQSGRTRVKSLYDKVRLDTLS